MSGFLGGGSGSSVKPQYTGLQTQTSSSLMPLPIVWGAQRIAPNIIWYGDFQSHKQKQKVGKGGSTVSGFTYSASLEVSLCMGEIAGVGKMWKDQSSQSSVTVAGWTIFYGTDTQTPWPYLLTSHSTQALSYAKVAYLAAPNYDLGQSNTLGQHSFEVLGRLHQTGVGGTVPDADPALVVQDFLTNVDFGTIFPTSSLDLDALLSSAAAPTTGDSAYQTYCQAMGLALSPALSSQETANNILDRWTTLTNTQVVWTGYILRLVPRGDQSVTGNGVTYNPPLDVAYSLADSDYIRMGTDQDPILLTRADPADAYNMLNLNIKNRANDYNDAPVPWIDQSLIDRYGPRPAPDQDGTEVCDLTMAGKIVAILGQRGAYVRNTYQLKLSPRYCRIEPTDVLECWDPRWGTILVRVTDVTEGDDLQLTIDAEELPIGVATTVGQGAQSSGATPINTEVAPSPVNPPILLEPRSDLTGGVAQVWAAVSGGDGTTFDPNWGGCNVLVSSDNVTYQQIGTIDSPARMGKIVSATLPAYGGANPDTVNTAHVDLTMSGGELVSVSSGDASTFVTLMYVGGELLSYEDATLISQYIYDLSTQLYRGLYGTTAGSHALGSAVARLDDSIFKWDLPADRIGTVVYMKFQSFNIFGRGLQDLSTCVAYTITPTGTGFGSGAGGVPAVPTGLTTTPGVQSAVVTWAALPATDNVQTVQIWRATGLSQPFSSATRVATVDGNALQYIDVNLLSNQGYTYFLVAVNAAGASTNTAGSSVTTSGLISGGGASASITASEDIAAGDFVNVYSLGGLSRVRRADATDKTKFANGFALGSIASGTSGTVNFTGMNATVNPATPGEVWLSETTPGGYQTTPPPVTATGHINQSLGTATPAVGIAFAPGTRFEI